MMQIKRRDLYPTTYRGVEIWVFNDERGKPILIDRAVKICKVHESVDLYAYQVTISDKPKDNKWIWKSLDRVASEPTECCKERDNA